MSQDKEQVEAGNVAEAIAARPRWHVVVDLSDFVGHTGEALGKVAVIVNSKLDDWEAQREAHAEFGQLSKQLPGGQDTFKDDDTILADLKDAFVVHRALRKPDNLNEHVFPAPQWLARHLDNEELGTLTRLCNHARWRKAGLEVPVTDDQLRSLRDAVFAQRSSNLPGEWALAHMPRWYIDAVFVEAMVLWSKDSDALVVENARLRAELDRLTGKSHASDNELPGASETPGA